MRTFTRLAVAAFVLVVPFAVCRARSSVYRCVLNGGQISYQQIPCSPQSKPVEIRDTSRGWSPLRPGERRLLDSYRDKGAGRRRASTPPKPAPKASTACWKKRQQLDAVRSRLHRGYKLKEGDDLRRKQRGYEEYLRQFCAR
jgi:hypothetical protein